MSFLTSLLSDIDPSAAAQAPTPSVKPPQPPKPPKPAPIQAAPTNGIASTQPTKRKAEGDATPVPNKVQRRDAPNGTSGTVRPVQGVYGSKPKAPGAPDPLPYRGTATSTTNILNASKPQKRTPDPSSKPSTGTQSTYTGSGPAVKAAPRPVVPQAPPKAGSYAAILAKAKEAAANPAVLTIKHKPAEILTRKERLARLAEAKAKKPAGVDRKPAPNKHAAPGHDAVRAKAGPAGKEKPKPKAVDLGYQGTMRPKPTVESGYQGTMRGGPPPPHTRAGTGPAARKQSFDRSRSGSLAVKPKAAAQKGGRMAGRAYYSQSDLDDEEEDDYGSDESSDMEAGAWDVEEEERKALLTAKKEDEEELRRENELKRLKAERKRKGYN
ncbi:uncharacterized protein BDZ99DRAFT_87746 [Mytilinidion resinicola]|uniref:SPT2-domain-containing protein n=1 Tax=Mytilinidion resinicola TaxID=574789 RepID=A0A6A6YFV0_9PEZI|nr:uncharacterized protein BDZ99DRAFT_87746 [Mytilinidion resinicola]KAF2806894.1 hypothetical protein BDZ99DRAFT_87746 [Mytilinidion resinicola]